MRWWQGLSVRISAASILVLLIVVAVANQVSVRQTSERLANQLDANADSIVARWQLGLIEPIWNLNTDQARRLVEVEFIDRSVEAAEIVDASGTAMVGLQRLADGSISDFTAPPANAFRHRQAALEREGEVIGEVRLWLSDRTIVEELAVATRADLWKFAGVGITLVVILNLLLRRWVTSPLSQMSGIIGKLVELRPGEPLDQITRSKNLLVGRYGRDASETGALTRALDRFVALFGELKSTTDAAQRAGRGLACASANLALLDQQGRVVLVNEAFAGYLGRHEDTRTELGGEQTLAPGGDLGAVLARWIGQPLHSVEGPLQRECEIASRHGKLDLAPVASDNGERVGYVVQWHDMTEFLRQQQVERNIAAELSRVVAAATAGDLTARIDTGDAVGVLAELSDEVNQLLAGFDEALDRIQELHSALAAGNLGYRLKAPTWKGVFASVRDNANQTIGALAELVSTLREAARSVASGASEIRAGTDELSRRIEQQAASLEESAAAMRDMSQSVVSNERDSQDARTQSSAANDAAKRGGEAIARMQTRMAEIGKGSRKIMEIVGLIDDIAFQTNLLALNAAVEAARAGEMGRGFAVVATEVRALAKRAADNAKDIRSLLSSSDSEVQQGIALAGDLSRAIGEISESVGRSAELARTIADATSDQAQGIRQVETVIGDLDGITQQNSAIAEQTAAASATLDDQAGSVMDMLSRFSLGETGNTGVPAVQKREKRK